MSTKGKTEGVDAPLYGARLQDCFDIDDVGQELAGPPRQEKGQERERQGSALKQTTRGNHIKYLDTQPFGQTRNPAINTLKIRAHWYDVPLKRADQVRLPAYARSRPIARQSTQQGDSRGAF